MSSSGSDDRWGQNRCVSAHQKWLKEIRITGSGLRGKPETKPIRGKKKKRGTPMNIKKKPKKLNRKAWIEPEMMESEAFRSLSGTAMWVLLRFYQKRKWSDVKVNGKKTRVYQTDGLTFTYSEAEYFGIPGKTFYRAIKTIVERGFLDVEHRGGTFGHGEIKDYTRFKISHRWKLWGKPEFIRKEFKRLKYQGMDVHSRLKLKAAVKSNSRPLS
jgi:hypothetical protein